MDGVSELEPVDHFPHLNYIIWNNLSGLPKNSNNLYMEAWL
jgi:hypothetical protein